MKTDITLIIGASGQVGSEVAKNLKAEGYKVRLATSKNAADKDSVQLNLITGEGVKAAFEGVDRAFIMAPPPHADQQKILSPLIQEAKRTGLKKVVMLSAWGANHVDSPFCRAEMELEKSGLNYNIIRPNWYMQNNHTYWIHGIKTQGKLLVPAAQAKTSFIDTSDIGAVAAKLLLSEKFNNRDFDLSGPENLTHEQTAQAMSEITGKKIEYVDMDPQEFKQMFLSAGVPKDYVEVLHVILGALRAGYTEGVNSNVKDITGREPKTFQQYVKENKEKFL